MICHLKIIQICRKLPHFSKNLKNDLRVLHQNMQIDFVFYAASYQIKRYSFVNIELTSS